MSRHELLQRLALLTFAVLAPWGARAQAPADCAPTELWALDAATPHRFGYSVDVDGTIAAAGNGSADSVTIWRREAGAWVADALLDGSHVGPDFRFGASLAVSGNVVAVGVKDQSVSAGDPEESWVEVYRHDGSGWTLEASLLPSDRDPAYGRDAFGMALDVSGDLVVVGARWAVPFYSGTRQDTGAAYVYRHSGGSWVEEAILTPEVAGATEDLGFSVAVDGDRVVVGAPYTADPACPPTADCDEAGVVHAFTWTGAEWVHEAELRAPGAEGGFLGTSLDLEGDRLVAGAPWAFVDHLVSDTDIGALFVWQRDAGTGEWELDDKLQLDLTPDRQRLGMNVGLSGDWIMGVEHVFGVRILTDPGVAHLWKREGASWEHQGSALEGGPDDEFGVSAALGGDSLFVGQPATGLNVGTVWSYSCPSMMSADLNDLLTEPSAIDLRVAPPLDLRLQGNFLVLGWEETMGDDQYQIQVGTLLSLWRDRGYDHAPLAPCIRPVPEAEIELPEGDRYFLVVAVDSADDSESSYGRDSFGRERPAASGPCP